MLATAMASATMSGTPARELGATGIGTKTAQGGVRLPRTNGAYIAEQLGKYELVACTNRLNG